MIKSFKYIFKNSQYHVCGRYSPVKKLYFLLILILFLERWIYKTKMPGMITTETIITGMTNPNDQ